MRAALNIVEYPLLLLWPGDLGDLGGEGNSGFRNYSNIMRQGNVMVWWKYLNSCTRNWVSSYSSFNIWSAERLKDGNDASSATYMHFQSCRPVHSPTLVSGFPCSHRWPGKIMSVRGLLRPITAPPTLAAKTLQPGHGHGLCHF